MGQRCGFTRAVGRLKFPPPKAVRHAIAASLFCQERRLRVPCRHMNRAICMDVSCGIQLLQDTWSAAFAVYLHTCASHPMMQDDSEDRGGWSVRHREEERRLRGQLDATRVTYNCSACSHFCFKLGAPLTYRLGLTFALHDHSFEPASWTLPLSYESRI